MRHVFTRVLEKAEAAADPHSRPAAHVRVAAAAAGAPIIYVSAAARARDASITVRVYAHWLPDASQREVDRLDTPQPSATPAQPEAFADAA